MRALRESLLFSPHGFSLHVLQPCLPLFHLAPFQCLFHQPRRALSLALWHRERKRETGRGKEKDEKRGRGGMI